MARSRILVTAAAAVLALTGSTAAFAAKCSSTGGNFESWKADFAAENGLKGSALSAFMGTSYATKTINADRNQKSFKLSFDQFMAKRGGQSIISKGKGIKNANAALFASIEKRYGVPAGPLIAIWGMETGFGSYMGNQNTLSAVATLAYDCRRTEYFTEQLQAALKLVQNGTISGSSIGAMHGEIGQTQFLPSSYIKYGVDFDGNGHVDLRHSVPDVLASTANLLKTNGWRAGGDYHEGSANFDVMREWNRAVIYRKTIAYFADRLVGQ